MSGAVFIIIFLLIFGFLFFPIYLEGNVYYDLMQKKCAIEMHLFKFIKIFGGYITTYKGGLAIHKNRKSAVLLPFEELNNERKRFSFIKTFKFVSFHSVVECSVDYFFFFELSKRIYNIIKKINPKLKNTDVELWLTEKKSLKLTANCILWFNLFILLIDIIGYIRGKLKSKWLAKPKKSMI